MLLVGIVPFRRVMTHGISPFLCAVLPKFCQGLVRFDSIALSEDPGEFEQGRLAMSCHIRSQPMERLRDVAGHEFPFAIYSP